MSSRLPVRLLGLAALAALAATVAVGLGLPPTEEQEVYARLIAIHPPLAWVAYLSFGIMGLGSLLWLWSYTRHRRWDRLAGAAAEVGVVFTALMLATGSIWGRPTWGVWWVWDARLTLSALMFALLLGYLALRRVAVDGDRRATISAVAGLAAVAVVPINHFAISWWRTLHQGRSIARPDPSSELDGVYIQAMLLGFVAMTLAFSWMLARRYQLAALEERLEAEGLTSALEERRAEGRELAGAPLAAGEAS